MGGCWVRSGGFKETWWEVSHLMCQHMLLDIPLCGKAPVACCADERSLLGMASVVDIQGTLTGKILPTYITVSVLTDPLLTQVNRAWRIVCVVK